MENAPPSTERFAIPPGVQWRTAGDCHYLHYAGASAKPGSPVLVLVHGISRRLDQLIAAFVAAADRHDMILVAPFFDKGSYGQYQQVIDRKGNRSDLALFEILDAVKQETGADTGKVHLFGFSGGAQFAHRFALLHPDRVASMTLASAGWYTMPTRKQPYPMGTGTHPLPFGRFDLRNYLAIDRHVLVGADDIVRDETLRQSGRVDRLQGLTRVDRAERWVRAMNRRSERMGSYPQNSSFQLLPGVGHSFEECTRGAAPLPERVMACITPTLAGFA